MNMFGWLTRRLFRALTADINAHTDARFAELKGQIQMTRDELDTEIKKVAQSSADAIQRAIDAINAHEAADDFTQEVSDLEAVNAALTNLAAQAPGGGAPGGNSPA